MNLLRKEVIFFSILILLVAGLTGVSADFEIGGDNDTGSYYIDTLYGPGDYLRGWVNISLDNEIATSLLTDTEGNEVELLAWLESDTDIGKDVDYSCSPSDCEDGYSTNTSETSKTLELETRRKKVVGFEFSEDIANFDFIRFNVTSDAGADCNNQLKINFFDDLVLGNNKSSNTVCGGIERRGCFNGTQSESFLLDSGNKFCQKIKFTESPRFRLGAFIATENDDDEIRMWVYDSDFDESKGSCTFTAFQSSEGTYNNCEIDLATTEEEEYYVCIDTEEVKDDMPEIKGYSAEGEDACAFYQSGSGVETANLALDIYVQGMQFAPFEYIYIDSDDDFPNDVDLGDLFEDYISEKYNADLNCEETPCVVPIKLIPGTDQDVTIKDILIRYQTETKGKKDLDLISDLDVSPARVSTVQNEFKKISLNNINFSLPTDIDIYDDYKLELNDEEIFEETITIEEIPSIKSLTPLVTASGFPTPLKVDVGLANNASIKKYEWKIENKTPETTVTNTLEYVFPSIKPYDVEITITDVNDKTVSKSFTVIVNSPETMINNELARMQDDLANIIDEIGDFPLFHKNSIENVIDTDDLNDQLTAIKQERTQIGSAPTQDDYDSIISKILALRIPQSITEGLSSSSVSFYPQESNIDIETVSQIAGGTYESGEESEYKTSVLEWSASNLDTKVQYRRINGLYNGQTETLLSIFDIHVKEIVPTEYPYYLFVKKMDNLMFDKDYNEQNASGSDYVGIRIESDDEIIKLSTTEDITFTNLPVFISPSLDNLQVLEIIEGEEPGIRWALFILIIFFLLIFGVAIYIVMQYWYKTKYETYLFKNRNYLFNLINYINTQKKKGTKEKDIIKRLKKQGWNSEQITYVMRKYLGKRTGMWEIPVEKILKKFRKKPAKAMPSKTVMQARGAQIAKTGRAPPSATQRFGGPGPRGPGRF